ncbi:hypothetical protein [Hymenobacter metallilatus]|uniref:Uncharacterized protein n=1 Tax=Hymenobacter metallilatus TaxID=2493666 RepID=A0A428JCM9_9BACT|nr:hypothetical protein [Hymenobacter metallilatus]RSK29877.1 hypothetical protein EI290_16210 [Hymenobacter metallilatus]
MSLVAQLHKQRELNARLVRARRRLLHSPCPFYVRRFFICLIEANLYTDSLLTLEVPAAHDKCVHKLLATLHISVAH